MGFEVSASSLDGVILNKLEINKPVFFYLKDVICETNTKFGTPAFNILAVDPVSGREVKLLTGGTAKWFAQNVAGVQGKVPLDPKRAAQAKEDMNNIGVLNRITKIGTFTMKGKEIAKFEFARDLKKTLLEFEQTQIEKEAQNNVTEIPF